MAGGEGVVALLVRRVADAVADGDHIYGLLRGIAVNNDGGDATGFYSPSVSGQSRLIRQVLDRTGVDPRTIGYVEAHGTGTSSATPWRSPRSPRRTARSRTTPATAASAR